MMDAGTLKPLDAIRVLDFTSFPPGGACTVMLADLGAEVIRVEPPSQKGKPSLVIGQVALSRGKQSIALDLRQPGATAVLERLAPGIDVVVENARAGAMEARGFGYEQARAINPGIVWCAITGFGREGPYADHSGHDLNYMAHSGLLGALSPDREWHPALPLALQAGALSATVAIQAALLQRHRSGLGGFIDLSLSEAATWLLTCGINALSDRAFALPVTPDRRVYACADGRHVAIACSEPRTWAALCEGLGAAELIPHLHKPDQAESATKRLAELFAARSAAEWMKSLPALGAAVTIVNHAAQIVDDPHVRARGSVVTSAGVAVPVSPVRLTAADGARTGTATEPPHRIGDDTARILSGAGFTADDIAVLEAAAII